MGRTGGRLRPRHRGLGDRLRPLRAARGIHVAAPRSPAPPARLPLQQVGLRRPLRPRVRQPGAGGRALRAKRGRARLRAGRAHRRRVRARARRHLDCARCPGRLPPHLRARAADGRRRSRPLLPAGELVTLSAIIFLPLVVGLIASFAPRRQVGLIASAGSIAVLVYAIVLLAGYPSSGGGMKWAVNDTWIRELGIHYSLGVDGLNLFLIVLTALLWAPATIAAALREWDSPRVFFFNLGLAQTAVLGAFCAQDVALFVFFFDLMLVPFYFLIGAFGGRRRVQATTKFVIYTLVGSLLMLAAAVALGVLSAGDHGAISFKISDLAQHPLSGGDQEWI